MYVLNRRMKIPKTCHYEGRDKGKPKEDIIINKNTSLKMVKEVQALNEKLVALGRFLSKFAENTLLFYKMLKRLLGKKKGFSVDKGSEECVSESQSNINRIVYFNITNLRRIFDNVLNSIKDGSKCNIGSQQGRKTSTYILCESHITRSVNQIFRYGKVSTVLLNVAIRLKGCFLAHTIEVLRNVPRRQMLLKPEKSGRIAKRAMELGEHEIVFKP